RPKFQIRFDAFFEDEVESYISPTTAATNYKKAINKTGQLSGLLLFGLQLQMLKDIRKSRIRQCTKNVRPSLIKPADKSSESTLDNPAVNYHLPREHIIVIERNNLTQRITKDILIKLVNMNKEAIDNLEAIEESKIDFSNILSSVGTGEQCDCKGILRYLIPYLVDENLLLPHNPSECRSES
ncbi:1927_t:CDS:2, partial [Racocetra fulgida]